MSNGVTTVTPSGDVVEQADSLGSNVSNNAVNAIDGRIDAAVPFPIEVRLPDVHSVAENSEDRSSVQQLTAARFGIPGDPVGSKYRSAPISRKTTALLLP